MPVADDVRVGVRVPEELRVGEPEGVGEGDVVGDLVGVAEAVEVADPQELADTERLIDGEPDDEELILDDKELLLVVVGTFELIAVTVPERDAEGHCDAVDVAEDIRDTDEVSVADGVSDASRDAEPDLVIVSFADTLEVALGSDDALAEVREERESVGDPVDDFDAIDDLLTPGDAEKVAETEGLVEADTNVLLERVAPDSGDPVAEPLAAAVPDSRADSVPGPRDALTDPDSALDGLGDELTDTLPVRLGSRDVLPL